MKISARESAITEEAEGYETLIMWKDALCKLG